MKDDCTKITALLDEYVDDELSSRQKKIVAAHIKKCEKCRAKLQEIIQLSAIVHTLVKEPCPDKVVERAMHFIAPAGRTARVRDFFALLKHPDNVWRFAAGLAAATALVVFLAIWPWRSDTTVPGDVYTEAEIAQARVDVERALGYISRAIQKTQSTLENEVVPKQVVRPLKAGLNAALGKSENNGG